MVRDVASCKLNIPYMKELGLNAVRVYTVDNAAYPTFTDYLMIAITGNAWPSLMLLESILSSMVRLEISFNISEYPTRRY